jgi:hypothetical protein
LDVIREQPSRSERRMNAYFVAAGVLAFAIGLVHSVLGERLVFRRMRGQGLVPTDGGHVLHEPHVRILWASWHVVTALGWCVAAVLLWLGQPSQAQLAQSVVAKAVVGALFVSSMLVLVGTKGRHPGWIGLLIAAILVLAGMYA